MHLLLSRRFSSILKFLIPSVIIILILAAILLLGAIFSPIQNNYHVIIKSGSNGNDIITKFKDHKLISTTLEEISFKVLVRFFESHNQYIKAGEYSFVEGESLIKVLNKLFNEETVTRSITIPEGSKAADIVSLINNAVKMEGQVSLKDIPEGSVMPETYFYKYGTSRLNLLHSMQGAMKNFLDDNNVKDYKRVITIASLVQAEAYNNDEMPIIAGIIQKRLNINMKLQLCSTIHYAYKLADHNYMPKHLYYKDLKIDSPYNTYKITGTPPTPINSPGKAAILATLNPEKTEYLYFFTKDGQNHIFSKTYNKHIIKQNIK